MIVCLDTNVLIQARASRHAYGVLLDSFAFGLMDLAVSNRVLTEYWEIITGKAGANINPHLEIELAQRRAMAHSLTARRR